MFIFTKKITKRNLVVTILAVGVLLCAVIVLVSSSDDKGTFGRASTYEERIAFVKSFGWNVEDEEDGPKEVVIPRDFDDVMTEYNLLQKAQGLDLTDYAGCRVKRYTYYLTAYPTGEQGVVVNILVYDGKVIGGDVMSSRLDGFMHGLEYFGKYAE